MKLSLSAVLLSCSLAASVPMLAQTADVPPPPTAGHDGGPHGPGGFEHGRMHGFTPAAPVPNAPFTAQFSATSTFTDREGKASTHTSTSSIYRDSLGRTREDVTLPAPPPRPAKPAADGTAPAAPRPPRGPHTVITILDPVANTITHLETERKVAVVQTVPADFFKHMLAREEHGANGPRGGNAQDANPDRPRPTVTDLGSKTFAGVSATGKKITITFPARDGAGTHTMASEHWFSPDLKLQVSDTETGDRGSHANTITAITKAEPDASLFKVPEGYTVKTAPEHGHGGPGGRGPGGHGPHGPGGPDAPPPPPPAE